MPYSNDHARDSIQVADTYICILDSSRASQLDVIMMTGCIDVKNPQ